MSKPHNVFISWAGEHAKQIAILLRDWLPDVCKDAKPWMSDKDIDKGADWSAAIDQTIASCKVCIVILTPESVKSQWVHFEAGALYKGLGENAICTLLCGAPTPIQFPLAKFQRTDFNKEQMEALTRTINTRLGDDVEQARHRRMIDAFWINIEEPIRKIIADSQKGAPTQAKSPERLMLEEILETVRQIQSGRGAVENIDPQSAVSLVPRGISQSNIIKFNNKAVLTWLSAAAGQNLKDIGLSQSEFRQILASYASNKNVPAPGYQILEVTRNMIVQAHFNDGSGGALWHCTIERIVRAPEATAE